MRRPGHGSDRDESIDDEDLERAIADEIENDPTFWMGRGKRRTMIVVEVDGGLVTLSGIVRTPREKRLADIIARALGAVGVDNRLRLGDELKGKSS